MPDPTMLNAFLFLGLFIGTNNAENIAISARGLVTDYPQHAELFRTALRSTLNTLDDLYAPGRVPLLRQAFQLALDTLSKVDPAAQIDVRAHEIARHYERYFDTPDPNSTWPYINNSDAVRKLAGTMPGAHSMSEAQMKMRDWANHLSIRHFITRLAGYADLLQPYHPFDFAQVIYHLMHFELDDTEVREFRAMLWKELDTMHQTALKALDHA
jgi:hypothetical protein